MHLTPSLVTQVEVPEPTVEVRLLWFLQVVPWLPHRYDGMQLLTKKIKTALKKLKRK